MATLRLKAFDVVSDLLIWVAFVLGVIGAFALTATPMGESIGKFFNIFPVWVVLPLALLGLAMVVFDIKDDGIPNRLRTMYIAVVWPSALLGVDGPLATIANGWIHGMNNKIFEKLGPLIADDPKHTGTTTIMATIAVTCIVFALYTAHRYYAGRRANRATTNTNTNTTSSGTGSSKPIQVNRKTR